jgi:phenylpyruvate tautomerase PptA (4-oxalocrotonate tautomerase family)
MIDVYAAAGTFSDSKKLAMKLAATLMRIEGVPDIQMFRQNTAAFIHELGAGNSSNVDGEDDHVRVQVLTNAGALDREKQLAVVEQFSQLVANAAPDDNLKDRVWVLLTEAVEGGWGLWGHAHTNPELVQGARDEIARLTK